MTAPETNPDALIQEKLREYLERQPWWRRYSNTVTTTVGGLVTLAWWLTSTGVSLPEEITYTVAIVLFIGGVLGVNKTKNGVTPALADLVTKELSPSIAEYRNATHDG